MQEIILFGGAPKESNSSEGIIFQISDLYEKLEELTTNLKKNNPEDFIKLSTKIDETLEDLQKQFELQTKKNAENFTDENSKLEKKIEYVKTDLNKSLKELIELKDKVRDNSNLDERLIKLENKIKEYDDKLNILIDKFSKKTMELSNKDKDDLIKTLDNKLDTTTKSLQQSIDKLTDKLKTLGEEITESDKKIETLEDTVEKNNKDIEELHNNIEQILSNIKNLNPSLEPVVTDQKLLINEIKKKVENKDLSEIEGIKNRLKFLELTLKNIKDQLEITGLSEKDKQQIILTFEEKLQNQNKQLRDEIDNIKRDYVSNEQFEEKMREFFDWVKNDIMDTVDKKYGNLKDIDMYKLNNSLNEIDRLYIDIRNMKEDLDLNEINRRFDVITKDLKRINKHIGVVGTGATVALANLLYKR